MARVMVRKEQFHRLFKCISNAHKGNAHEFICSIWLGIHHTHTHTYKQAHIAHNNFSYKTINAFDFSGLIKLVCKCMELN